jgi:hypothetical protein
LLDRHYCWRAVTMTGGLQLSVIPGCRIPTPTFFRIRATLRDLLHKDPDGNVHVAHTYQAGGQDD